jgi:hypothetical protein
MSEHLFEDAEHLFLNSKASMAEFGFSRDP